jgi:predicted PurR-regulated permease PerM
MAVKSATTDFQRLLAVLGSLVLIVASLSLAQKILLPLLMAVLFTFILAPLVAALQRCGLKKVYAVLTVVLLVLGLLGGVVWMVISQLHALAGEMPQHRATITQKIEQLQQNGQGVISRLWQMAQEISQEVERGGQPEGEAARPEQSVPVVMKTEPSFLRSSITGMAAPLLEGLASAALVTVLVCFMLIQREDLRNRMLRLFGHGRLTSTTKAVDDAAQRISRFLLMQSIINGLFAVLTILGLLILQVPYALLWGLLAGCMRFIPYVGIWIAILFPVTYSFAISPGWYQPALVIGLFIILEILTANVLEPILLGHSTGISPIALLVAAAFWTWLWGPIGLILSTPLTTCLVVLGKYVPSLQFLDTLLGNEPALETNVSFYQRLLARDQDEAVELIEEYLEKAETREKAYDEVLLSALVFVKRDQEQGLLEDDERAFIIRAVRDVLEDLPAQAPGEAPPAAEVATARVRVLVFACPARDEADEVALQILSRMLEPCGCRIEVLSHKMLFAEMVSRVETESPDLVCIASLPPGGLAQIKYLCKRLRARVPGLKIAVGRWGQQENVEQTRERLRTAGADYVATSLSETRQQILSLMPVLEAAASDEAEGAAKEPALAKTKANEDTVPV